MQLSDRLGRLYGGVIYDALSFDFRWSRPFVVEPGFKPVWPMPPGEGLCGSAYLQMDPMKSEYGD